MLYKPLEALGFSLSHRELGKIQLEPLTKIVEVKNFGEKFSLSDSLGISILPVPSSQQVCGKMNKLQLVV